MFIRIQRSLAKFHKKDVIIKLDNIEVESEDNKFKIKMVYNNKIYIMGEFNSFTNATKAIDYIYEQALSDTVICTVPEDDF